MSTAAPAQRRKQPKPTVTPPRTVDEWVVKNLNNDIVTLVILSWELGVTNASMAVVDRADACGFDMRCLNNRGQAVHHRVTYRNAPCTTVDAVKKELAELRERASRPRFPVTPMTAFVVVMWAVLIFAWGHKHGVHVLEERVARWAGLHEEDVPSSKEFLTYCTLGVLAANAVEGAAVVFLARKRFAFSWRSCAGWFGMALVAGYPVAQKMLDLKSARSRALMTAYRKMQKGD
jgi:hypothetical protein